MFTGVVGENEKPIIVDEARIGTLQERLECLGRLAQCRWPNLKHLETWNATHLYSDDAKHELPSRLTRLFFHNIYYSRKNTNRAINHRD